jgi:hypothetical protein
MKEEFEDRPEEQKKFLSCFELILKGETSFDSSQVADLIKEFILQPASFQKKVLTEIMKNRGEAIIPLASKLMGLDENMSEVIVDSLVQVGDETTVQILRRLVGETGDKKVDKLVKKALYRLKLKGIACPDFKKDEGPVFKKISLPQPEAYVSHIDGLGDRLIILAIPESLKLYQTYSFVVNDWAGIKDLQEAFMRKKDLVSYLSGKDDQYAITMVEVDYPYAQYLLHLAYQKNMENTNPLPLHFTTRHRTLFHGAEKEQPSLIYRFLMREEIEQNRSLLDYVSHLFDTPEIQSWQADKQSTSEYRNKIDDLNLSPLIVSKVAKEERIESIIKEATREIFTPEQRQRYTRRLEETAYIFWKTNRKREAEISVGVALTLSADSIPLEAQVFPREFIRRSLFSDGREKEREKDSQIILPNPRVII